MQSTSKGPAPTNLYVIAENRLLRETLMRLFRKRGDIAIVGDCCCSDTVIEDIASAGSDVLLLDCFSAKHESEPWFDKLRESAPEIRIVLFGMDDDAGVFLRAVRMGIAGYVLKNASSAELLDAVRTVAQGEAACPARFCKVLFKALAETSEVRDARAAAQYGLTHRQRQLMSLVAKGLSNKEIAANLNLSEFTVKNHIHRVMKLVDAESRHEAVELLREGV